VLKSTRIAAGGGAVGGGTYALNGTVGQHDATVVSAQGGATTSTAVCTPVPPPRPDNPTRFSPADSSNRRVQRRAKACAALCWRVSQLKYLA
jgi:hypothetical protein